MTYRQDLWEVAAANHGVVTITDAEDAGVPAVEVRKLAHRGALRAYGQGVYAHLNVPPTATTQLAVAAAMAGEAAFLQRETVLDLHDLGQLNPHRVRVATHRRVRRTLPDWIDIEHRADIAGTDLTEYSGVRATTVRRALHDLGDRMSPDRWRTLVAQATRRELISEQEASALLRHRWPAA
ncbi:type IV toxin-antitoxin system AbiEi family antitoxin domain-containing protein [Gordonia malaquae]|uniref:type IV toxin-antitoxin system AbiEi family antitoxin domain-containing protein n=1 Tax=Gordonia malaquae TaxID=410332 RepID=UPI0030178476